ncbi:MAG: sulfatase-like hydrolase/transferase [bacterium]|nr:sulfatase-like hydrolase/transferase [bacterium]
MNSQNSGIHQFRGVFFQFSGLVALAIVQPLLQLVKSNPEFLVVHHSQIVDVAIFLTALLLLLPYVLALMVQVTGKLSSSAGMVFHSIVVCCLLILVFLPMGNKMFAGNGWLVLGISTVMAAGLTFVLGRSGFLFHNLSFLAISVPLVVLVFLGDGSVRKSLFNGQPSQLGGNSAEAKPVVFIVLDELPISALMKSEAELDRDLFPNFCRLADISTWYRNATTVSGATLRSVPAILTGVYPQWNDAPSLEFHPNNIFTLLGSSHQVHSLESQTNLCPKELNSELLPNFKARLELLFSDLYVLYQHIVVPDRWKGNLVPVSNKWNDFRGTLGKTDRTVHSRTKVESFERFIDAISLGNKPNLEVAHILLPHNPYKFFPNGQIYNWREKVSDSPAGMRNKDSVYVAHSYRRFLLQLGAVDRLLGLLLDRLDELGILEESLIVVTADHGAGFRVGVKHRQLEKGNEADVLGVPLFFKKPQQMQGEIDDQFVQTVDILPSLFAVLNCNNDWEFDGEDFTSPDFSEPEKILFFDQDKYKKLALPKDILKDRNSAIKMKNDLFGSSGGVDRLFAMDDSFGLIGREAASFPQAFHPNYRAEIIDLQKLSKLNVGNLFIPAEFNGTVSGIEDKKRITLALALNGKIAGISESYLDFPETGKLTWQITTSWQGFKNGDNSVLLYLVEGSLEDVKLVNIPLMSTSILEVNFATRPHPGALETGLYGRENWGGTKMRWTNGKASWEIPLNGEEKTEFLKVGLVSSGPSGNTLRVSCNGTELFNGPLSIGAWEKKLSLRQVDCGNKLSITLESDFFVPAERDSESSDRRKLGVAVSDLIFQ